MTRIAVVILVTGIAFVALIVLAGRMDWYAVSYRVSSGAIDALTKDEPTAGTAAAATQAISDPSTWNRDFMRGASSSADCPADTLGNVRTRMATIGPYTVDEFERTVASYAPTAEDPVRGIPTYNRVSELVRNAITAEDRIYVFGINPIAAGRDTRGVSGYFVARNECIVHVEETDQEN